MFTRTKESVLPVRHFGRLGLRTVGAAITTAAFLSAHPASANGSASAFSQANNLDIQYRDMGVILHATRYPFKTSASRFARDIRMDRNWTNPTVDRSLTRAVNSVGEFVRGRSGPVDVVMTVLRPRGAKGSTCVISYRGTDREHKYDTSIKDRIRVKEGGIPLSLAGNTLTGRGKSCKMKDGYFQNYLETRGRIFQFLNDATDAGQCTRGLVVMGMSMGGATASVAFTDLMMVKSVPVNDRVKALVQAKKVWLVTAGAPRALTDSCASDIQTRAGDRVKRFVYGSYRKELDQHGRTGQCARFVDPVPGNPYFIQSGVRRQDMQHFGDAILGYNTYSGKNPSTPDLKRAGRITCRAMKRCQSKRYANMYSRVATRSAQFFFPNDPQYPRVGFHSGAKCSAPGLVPLREYMFGRLHDTCSYRNLMAVYGQKYNGERVQTNHACALPHDADDTSDHPHGTCPLLGRDARGREICARPIHVKQLHQP